MSEENYAKWDAVNICEPKAFNPIIDERQVLSYSLDMVFLADGKYRIIFINDSFAGITASIKFDAKIARTTILAFPVYFSATLFSVVTSEPGETSPSGLQIPFGVLGLVGLIGAIAAVILLVAANIIHRRRIETKDQDDTRVY